METLATLDDIRPLTAIQRYFVYVMGAEADGNVRLASRICGLAESAGQRLMADPRVRLALQEASQLNRSIAGPEERQEWLTSVMRDSLQEMPNRLQACKILGAIQGDGKKKPERKVPKHVTLVFSSRDGRKFLTPKEALAANGG